MLSAPALRNAVVVLTLLFGAVAVHAESPTASPAPPDAYQQQIVFWQDVPRRAKYTEVWNEVKASQ